jgi:hypothetical protein
VEVGVFRDDQQELRAHLRGWSPFKCARPGAWDPWDDGERLDLPVHQVLARPPGSGPTPETWVPAAGDLQFFLNDVEDDTWVSRRDARVTLPVRDLVFVSERGHPAVVPEVQLLYKAKHHLDKDERDFEAAVPRLSGAQRAWLRAALELAHPDDPWLSRLDAPGA